MVFVFFMVFPLNAEQVSENEENDSAVTRDTSLTLQITTLPEVKLVFTQGFTFPLLQGDHFLRQDSNLKLAYSAEIAPVLVNLKGEATFTPIPLLQLVAGGFLGSGWVIPNLFGSEIRGTGFNDPVAHENGQRETAGDGRAFDGVFMGAHLGGAFQFSMAAVIPGDWNNVVFRTYHELAYKAYSRAVGYKEYSWFFENDAGENRNGYTYYGNYLIGYQMPIFLNTVALLAEAYKSFYDTEDGHLWGENLFRWEFSFVTNFTITQSFSAALITQLRTLRSYNNYEYGQDFNLYYRDRRLSDNRLRDLHFFRVALILQYRF